MKTKGKIRILQQGAKWHEEIVVRRYDENGEIVKDININEYESNKKIDKQRDQTYTKVMKALDKKNIAITSIEQDDQYTTINYEVQS